MQPLVSVDHESRHSSNRGDDGPPPTEQTPLLRVPRVEVSEPRDPVATLVITLLLVILTSGVIIGVYLLVVQSHSENVLPPVKAALQYVSESQWNENGKRPYLTMPSYRAKEVVVVQTDTEPCHGVHACTLLLRNMQLNQTQHRLLYNFLISSDGRTFEALGWRRSSPLFAQHPFSLVLAFIGNYSDTFPSSMQLDEAKSFFDESVSLQRLDPMYSIIGKNTQEHPKNLFRSLSKFPHWKGDISDHY